MQSRGRGKPSGRGGRGGKKSGASVNRSATLPVSASAPDLSLDMYQFMKGLDEGNDESADVGEFLMQ